MKNINHKYFLCISVVFVLLVSICGQAFPEKAKIALVSVDNSGKDPRYDYLEGLVTGILLYDLSSAEGITIVERSSLESILKEQELAASDLADTNAFKIGKILGADFLLKGGFVFMGDDIVLNLTLMEVATSKSITFSERGRTENLVHTLSEKLIKKLTGKDVALVSDAHERSIISLKDEKPGSISVFTPIVDAEIFLDNEFAAYSSGDAKTAVKIEQVFPGKHTVRLHLAGFGVLKTPELTFQDWEEEANVQPGKNTVLRARPYHYMDLFYQVQKLVSDRIRINPKEAKTFSGNHDITFKDRKGATIPCSLKISGTCDAKSAAAKIILLYGGKDYPFDIVCKFNETAELKKNIEKAEVSVTIEYKYENNLSIDYTVNRTDITPEELN